MPNLVIVAMSIELCIERDIFEFFLFVETIVGIELEAVIRFYISDYLKCGLSILLLYTTMCKIPLYKYAKTMIISIIFIWPLDIVSQ